MTVTLRVYRGNDTAVYPGLDLEAAMEKASDFLKYEAATKVEIEKEA